MWRSTAHLANFRRSETLQLPLMSHHRRNSVEPLQRTLRAAAMTLFRPPPIIRGASPYGVRSRAWMLKSTSVLSAMKATICAAGTTN